MSDRIILASAINTCNMFWMAAPEEVKAEFFRDAKIVQSSDWNFADSLAKILPYLLSHPDKVLESTMEMVRKK